MADPKKYLQKIRNDIDERLWDLLLVHLSTSYRKVKKKVHLEESKQLISLLETALELIQRDTRLSIFQKRRAVLMVCNSILKYDTERQDIKDVKKEVIAEFTHSEKGSEAKIDLDEQITEIRMTYDAGYLIHLTKSLMKQKNEPLKWVKALYCLNAVRLVEPDCEDLDDLEEQIKSNLSDKEPSYETYSDPKDYLLVMDANVVLSRILHDVGDFRINSKEIFDIPKISNDNKLIITPSVAKEVEDHIYFRLSKIKEICFKNPRFNYDTVKAEIEKRLKKMLQKYFREFSVGDHFEKIQNFYGQYPIVLEKILLFKLDDMPISTKLKKIADRKLLLPEEGDQRLLNELITLSETEKEYEIGLLTEDRDFTFFAEEIEEEFGISVFGPKWLGED